VYVLSVSSLKGGVGKTTVALGLASAAASRGLRTLVVDLDPQCDATTGLGAIGEFNETCADVLHSPRHNVVHRAIVSSTWSKILSAKIDIMVGSPKVQAADHPNPSIKELWRLEDALTVVEKDYDLVVIDTPPSINGLTKTAWVASDRIIVVTEPSLFSVVAADRSIRSINELRKGITRRLKIHGVVINRYKPLSREHQFRVNELSGKYGQRLLPQRFEEKSTIQQAQGAARPIHAWAGETAAMVAKKFDEILDGVLIDLVENPHIEITSRSKRKARKASKLNRSKRGKMDSLLSPAVEAQALDDLELLTGEIQMPAPFEESAETLEPTPSPEVEEALAALASAEESDVIPATPEALFEELLAETQRKLAEEADPKDD
jgi:chromosome partitioning protein